MVPLHLVPTYVLGILFLMLSGIGIFSISNSIPVRSENRERKKVKSEDRQYNCLVPLLLFAAVFVAIVVIIIAIVLI